LYFDDGNFRVKTTQKQGSVHLHVGEVVKGQLQVKDRVRPKWIHHAKTLC